MRQVFLILSSLTLAAGCAQFPDVDAATSPEIAAAPYPTLVPVELVLDKEAPRLDESSEAALDAQVNRLKRRASDLQSEPIE
ncbi:MAG: hypothetical protein GYB25_13235 [Rhodobacteraceae bacterium]|nr:hypothetical protein [Paracoccaceae bacterium]